MSGSTAGARRKGGPASRQRSPNRSSSGGRKRAGRGRGASWTTVCREAGVLIRRHRRVLVVGFLLLVVSRLAGLVIPASSKYVVDTVIINGRLDILYWLVGAGAVATLVQSGTQVLLSRLMGVNAYRAIGEVQRDVQAHVIRLPVRYFDSTKTGAVVSRIVKDPEGLQNLVGSGIVQLAGSVVTAVAALGVLLYLNWSLTLVSLVLLVVFAVIMGGSFRHLRPIYRDRARITAEITGRLTEALGGIRVVKTYGSEKREERVFTKGVHRLVRKNAEAINVRSAMQGLSTAVIGAVSVLIMLVGGRAAVLGSMTLGDLVMFVFFVKILTSPLVQIAAVGTKLTEAFAGLDRIREVMRRPTEAKDDEMREVPAHTPAEIVLDDVWFEYEPGRPVIRGVSVEVPAGHTTALVGPSGAGKSTLTALVMGFERPTSGRVLVAGQDLRDVRAGEYRRQLGVVLQETFLFDGTIRDNIAYSRPGATGDEIDRAARVAHCDEFIDRLPEGLDTVVGERGVKLSGGQRQRISIARAILADPRILILDEATSNVDAESEALIQDGLRSLREGRTTLVIAHRLSTVLSADEILVLDEGEVVERGPHDRLIKRDGLYRQLYERQVRVQRERFVNPGEGPTERSGRRSRPPGGRPSQVAPGTP